MDVQTIEQSYAVLQDQARQSAQALQTLGNKLQAAAQSGDQNAREWSLDLRELALSFQAEQQQVASLLRDLHAAMQSQAQPYQPQPYQQQPQGGFDQTYVPQQPTPGFAAQPVPQQGGGFLGGILNSGFARSVEMGAAFGIGDDLIKEIF